MNFLTKETETVLNLLSEKEFLESFTFVGGSAIAYYLQHRLSEDLDFFSWHKLLPDETDFFITEVSKKNKIEIIQKSKNNLDILIDDINVTFFANDWEVLKEKREILKDNIQIASLDLLCAMKINTLSLRAKYRDYYDLYVINKLKFDIKEMYRLAAFYLPGMNLKFFTSQLTYIDDIADENIAHLSPKEDISLEEIQQHFIDETKKLLR